MPKIHLRFKPTEKQTPMARSSAIYKLGGGARGGGKTHTLAGLAVQLSVLYPGNVGFAGRRDLDAFKNSTLKNLLDQLGGCPSDLCLEHHKTDKKITVRSKDPRYPSEILYGELKDPDSILSGEIGWFLTDEAFEIPQLSFNHLSGSLRHMLPDGTAPPYHGLLASNPAPGWLMDMFPVTEEEQNLYQKLLGRYGERGWSMRAPTATNPEKTIDFDYSYFPFRAEDNPHLDPGYVQRLIKNYQHDPVLLARFVYGIWDMNMEGLVYNLQKAHRWSPRVGGRKRLLIDNMPVELGIDPSNGSGNYAAVVVQQYRGSVHVVDEFKKEGGTDEDFIDWLHAQPYASRVSDAISDSALPVTVRRLRALGLQVRSVSKKDVNAQINALKALMAVDPKSGTAAFVVDESRCPQLLREFGLRSFARRSSKDPELNLSPRPTKKHDDLLNALEYWVMEKRPYVSFDDASQYRAPVARTQHFLRTKR